MSFLRAIVVGLLLAALCVPVASAQEPSESPIEAPVGEAGTESGTPVPFVPVRRFWSSQRDITLEEVVAAIEGRSDELKRVVVATADADTLWSSMGVQPASETEVVETVRAVKQALNKSRRTLGLVPAARVHAGLRALAVDGQALFGSGRVADLAEWPLMGADAGEGKRFDPQRVWTLMAGGDVMLDREPHRQSLVLGKGVDYVWDGGFAEIELTHLLHRRRRSGHHHRARSGDEGCGTCTVVGSRPGRGQSRGARPEPPHLPPQRPHLQRRPA